MLLHLDGCEAQESNLLYDTMSTLYDYQTTTRFSSGYSMRHYNTVSDVRKSITPSAQVTVGFACRLGVNTSFWKGYGFVAFLGDNAATEHVGVAVTSTWGLEIRRGTTVIATSAASNVIAQNAWFYIEVQVTISDTVGSVEVRLNGSSTPVVSFTGDTKNGGTSSNIDAVEWMCGDNSIPGYTDDIYILNSSGSSNTTFLGDCRVQTLFPNGAGNATGLTPSTGSNWQTVDEAPPSSSDYSGSPTSGARDTYSLTDLIAGTASIKGVKLSTFMHKSDSGTIQMKPALRVGSTNYYGSSRTLASSMTGYTDLYDTSPATSSAWTASEVNGSEAGAEVV